MGKIVKRGAWILGGILCFLGLATGLLYIFYFRNVEKLSLSPDNICMVSDHYDSDDGILLAGYAVNAEEAKTGVLVRYSQTGSQLWRTELEGTKEASTITKIDEGYLVVSDDNQAFLVDEHGGILQQTDLNILGENSDCPIYSVISDGTHIYMLRTLTEYYVEVLALNMEFEIQWNAEIKSQCTELYLSPNLIYMTDKLASTQEHTITAIRLTGEEQWSLKVESQLNQVMVDDKGFHYFNPETGNFHLAADGAIQESVFVGYEGDEDTRPTDEEYSEYQQGSIPLLDEIQGNFLKNAYFLGEQYVMEYQNGDTIISDESWNTVSAYGLPEGYEITSSSDSLVYMKLKNQVNDSLRIYVYQQGMKAPKAYYLLDFNQKLQFLETGSTSEDLYLYGIGLNGEATGNVNQIITTIWNFRLK